MINNFWVLKARQDATKKMEYNLLAFVTGETRRTIFCIPSYRPLCILRQLPPPPNGVGPLWCRARKQATGDWPRAYQHCHTTGMHFRLEVCGGRVLHALRSSLRYKHQPIRIRRDAARGDG